MAARFSPDKAFGACSANDKAFAAGTTIGPISDNECDNNATAATISVDIVDNAVAAVFINDNAFAATTILDKVFIDDNAFAATTLLLTR